MPVGRRFDFVLGGKGFMLARGSDKGRAWLRTGRTDAPGERSASEQRWGVLPDELDHPEVWDDWSGGFGYPYRRERENTYHWAENFDARFPRQLIHCQALVSLAQPVATWNFRRAQNFIEVPAINGDAGVNGVALWDYNRVFFVHMTASAPYVSAITDFGGTDIPSHQAALVASGWIVPGSQPNYDSWIMLFTGSRGFFVPDTEVGGTHYKEASNRVWMATGQWVGPHVGKKPAAVRSCDWLSPIQSGANWTATIAVGNQYYGINHLAELDGQLFVGKPDGLFAGDLTGTFVNVLSVLGSNIHEDNARHIVPFNGGLAVSFAGGVYLYRPGLMTGYVKSLLPVDANTGPYKGNIRTLAELGGWLYAGLWTGSRSYLMACQETPDGGIWHTLNGLYHSGIYGKIDRMYIDGITTLSDNTVRIPRRLWIANDDGSLVGSAPVYYQHMPLNNGNPLAQSTFTPNYVGSARIDLGAVDWGAPGTPKIYRTLEIWADNLSSGAQWCNLYYEIDTEGTRHLLGTSAQSPKDTIYFPSGEGSFVTGQSIALSLESFTASAGVTPIYRSIVLRGALQPRSVDLITAVVRVGDSVVDRHGTPMRSGAAMLKDLRGFGDPDQQGLQAHRLVDLMGGTQFVKVLGRVEEREVYQAGEDYPEVAATLRMAVLDYSGA